MFVLKSMGISRAWAGWLRAKQHPESVAACKTTKCEQKWARVAWGTFWTHILDTICYFFGYIFLFFDTLHGIHSDAQLGRFSRILLANLRTSGRRTAFLFFWFGKSETMRVSMLSLVWSQPEDLTWNPESKKDTNMEQMGTPSLFCACLDRGSKGNSDPLMLLSHVLWCFIFSRQARLQSNSRVIGVLYLFSIFLWLFENMNWLANGLGLQTLFFQMDVCEDMLNE